MTEEMKQKRDELAEKHEYIYLKNPRMGDGCSYHFSKGFDAAYQLMEAENNYLNRMLADERSGDCDKDKTIKRLTSNLEICNNELAVLKFRIEKLREALEFYGNKDNWLREQRGWRHDMIIKDLDDESLTDWEGRFSGMRARAALKADEGEG